MGIQWNSIYYLCIWTIPWSTRYLQRHSRPHSFQRLWSWRKYPHRHDDMSRVLASSRYFPVIYPDDTNVSQNRRFLLALLSIFQPLGVVVCSGIAYGFIPDHSCATDLNSCHSSAPGEACCTKGSNYGWRYLMFTLGAISFVVFILRFVVFTFQESPQYLLSKGKDEQALKVLYHIAKMNKQTCSLTPEEFKAISTTIATDSGASPNGDVPPKTSFKQKFIAELKRIFTLFATPALARLTILVWIIYAFDYWGFSVAGQHLPPHIPRQVINS